MMIMVNMMITMIMLIMIIVVIMMIMVIMVIMLIMICYGDSDGYDACDDYDGLIMNPLESQEDSPSVEITTSKRESFRRSQPTLLPSYKQWGMYRAGRPPTMRAATLQGCGNFF